MSAACDDTGGTGSLIDYKSAYCNIDTSPARAGALFGYSGYLLLLCALLGSTADRHFVPQLETLARKLRLSPEVAGITLLALGNGAPDIFTAMSGINGAGDFALVRETPAAAAATILPASLCCCCCYRYARPAATTTTKLLLPLPLTNPSRSQVLGELLGASTFISMLVLAAVLRTDGSADDRLRGAGYVELDKFAFRRDLLSYLVATTAILIAAVDGIIHLYEALILLGLYVAYVSVVVWFSPAAAAHQEPDPAALIEDGAADEGGTNNPLRPGGELVDDKAAAHASPARWQDGLVGLDRPNVEGAGPVARFLYYAQWASEWPVSLLRWLTIPVADEDTWGVRSRALCVLVPVCAPALLYVEVYGLAGATVGGQPVVLMATLAGVPVSLFLLRSSSPNARPNGYIWLVCFGFVTTIVWLDLQANECVGVAEALASLSGLSSSIMGLTVLAWGNSVGDFVADVAVGRKAPRMAVASCFGSPMLNDILGLGLSLTVGTVNAPGRKLEVELNNQLKVAYAFLVASLVSTLVVTEWNNHRLPRDYAWYLGGLYASMIVVQCLLEVELLG